MKNKIASLLAPVTLLEWGGILLYFYLSGRLNSFLHPSFRLQVLISGSLLVLCAIVLFITRHQKAVCECGIVENCPEQGRSPLTSIWFFPFLLLLPLAITAAFTRDSYGANILATRGVVDTAAALPGLVDKFSQTLPAPAKSAKSTAVPVIEPALPQNYAGTVSPVANNADPNTPPPTEDATAEDFFKPDANGNIQVNVADLLYAAEEPTLRTPFSGKSAEIIGQFMPAKSNNATGNRFKIVRLFMTCCAADAQPVSLLIEHDATLPIPAKVGEMAWTRVVGDISFPIENGRTIAVIKAKKIEPIDPPEETMLY